jgi:hypothetical protein
LWLLPFLILRGGNFPFGEKVVSGYEKKAKGLSFCLFVCLFVVGDFLGGSSSFEVKSSSTLVVWIATMAVDLAQYKL